MNEDSKQSQAIRHTNQQNPHVIISNGVHSIGKRNDNICAQAVPCHVLPVFRANQPVEFGSLNNSRQKIKAVINLFRKRFSRSIKGLKRLSKAKIKKSPLRIRVMLGELDTNVGIWRKYMRKWLTFAEVAEELGIPVKSIYAYHYRGDGPLVHRYGRHLRVLESDLLNWHERSVINR